MTEPLVSVVMIFLNEEQFLGEAIESVVEQSYSNWELLLCDDGSTDRSAEIAREWERRFPEKIRLLTHPGNENRGMSATRNLGLKHCRGELIGFLDGDDVWLPRKLEVQVAALQRFAQVSVVCSPTLYWHSWTGSPADEEHDGYSRLGGAAGEVTPGPKMLSRILRDRADALCTCAVLMKREAIDRAGGFENQFRGLFEDQAFFAKLLLEYDVLIVDECLDFYRHHPDSCCAEASRDRPVLLARRAEFLGWLLGYLRASHAPASLRRQVVVQLWMHRYPQVLQLGMKLRDDAESASGNLAKGAFSVGRLLIPAPLRKRLWSRFAGKRVRISSAARPGISRAASDDRARPTASST